MLCNKNFVVKESRLLSTCINITSLVYIGLNRAPTPSDRQWNSSAFINNFTCDKVKGRGKSEFISSVALYSVPLKSILDFSTNA